MQSQTAFVITSVIVVCKVRLQSLILIYRSTSNQPQRGHNFFSLLVQSNLTFTTVSIHHLQIGEKMIFRCVFSFSLFINHTLFGQKYWGPMLHHLHYPCRNSLYTVFMLTLMPEEVWKSGALQLLSQKSTGNFYSLCASAQLQHHA